MRNKIKNFREQRKSKHAQTLTVVKRSNKVFQALNLPKVLNLNPRSAMNKVDEIKTFIKEETIDVAFFWKVLTEKVRDSTIILSLRTSKLFQMCIRDRGKVEDLRSL